MLVPAPGPATQPHHILPAGPVLQPATADPLCFLSTALVPREWALAWSVLHVLFDWTDHHHKQGCCRAAFLACARCRIHQSSLGAAPCLPGRTAGPTLASSASPLNPHTAAGSIIGVTTFPSSPRAAGCMRSTAWVRAQGLAHCPAAASHAAAARTPAMRIGAACACACHAGPHAAAFVVARPAGRRLAARPACSRASSQCQQPGL